MRWMLASLVLAGSALFLCRRYMTLTAPPPPPAPAAAPAEAAPARPMLGPKDLRKIRASAANGDPEVRWAALQFLYVLRDPAAPGLFDRWMTDCADPALRLKAVELLRSQGDVASLQSLRKGLQDADKDVRLASLKGLGDSGDPAAVPWIAEALKDAEPEVKTEALRSLGRFQEKKKAEYAALAERLRQEYEAAVKKAEENAN